MAFEYDGRDWYGYGLKFIRNTATVTVEAVIEGEGSERDGEGEYEIPLADFCKALGLQPIKEEVRNGSELG